MLRFLSLLAVLVLVLLPLSACSRSEEGGGSSSTASAEPKRVTVYMYSEYIDPDLLTQFEKETGQSVRVDVYESSEEMLAKIRQAGGVKQYDVIVASDVVVPALIKLGLVQPLDMSVIKNGANVAADFRDPPFDPGSKYSMPYQWGTVGLMYRKDKAPATGDVFWALLFEEQQQAGPFILMDSMRDMLGIVLKYQGKSMNTNDPAAIQSAGELLIRVKKSDLCRGFEGGVGGKNKVLAGEAAAAVVYNGDAIKGISEAGKGEELAFAVPKEGGVIWTDVMLVSAQAPNAAGGNQFIHFILDAKNGAKLSNFNRYATPNQAALPLIEAQDRDHPQMYPSPEAMKNLEYLKDLGQDTKLFDEVWTAVKSR